MDKTPIALRVVVALGNLDDFEELVREMRLACKSPQEGGCGRSLPMPEIYVLSGFASGDADKVQNRLEREKYVLNVTRVYPEPPKKADTEDLGWEGQ